MTKILISKTMIRKQETSSIARQEIQMQKNDPQAFVMQLQLIKSDLSENEEMIVKIASQG